jgi:hypothetical protein
MLTLTEASLLMIYFISKEKNKRVYKLARRVHRKRKQNLMEFAELCYPREEYIGTDKQYFHDLVIYRRKQNLLMLVLVALFILSCSVCGDIPPY